MYNIGKMLESAVEQCASDIFIISGLPISYKIRGKIVAQSDEKILPPLSQEIITGIYRCANRDISSFLLTGDDDFSMSVPGLSRFRVCAYKQRGSLAAIIRTVNFNIPDYSDLNINEEVMNTVRSENKGLILMTGPVGSGKSTTLACMIDQINSTRNGHIITIEDPIEFIHRNKNCIVSQREIKADTDNYVTALRASIRQSSDVILVDEMRDLETIKLIMTAAETGHLVISTLHTVGAVSTIDRIINMFPANEQPQIRIQLPMLLRSVISQQLIPTTDGDIIPIYEIMHMNNAIRNMIRDSKINQIDTIIYCSSREGMVSMDTSIFDLWRKKIITADNALLYSANREAMEKKMGI